MHPRRIACTSSSDARTRLEVVHSFCSQACEYPAHEISKCLMRQDLNALHVAGKRVGPANRIPLVHRFCSQGCGQAEHTTRKCLPRKEVRPALPIDASTPARARHIA